MFEEYRVVGTHQLEGDEVGMGHGVGCEVTEVAVSTGLMAFGFCLFEDLATHPPGVAVAQVVSVFFAESDVGTDTGPGSWARLSRIQAPVCR